ncbi:MAG: APC family permease [Peptococcaceae bacterium]|jgi:amino acid transporter|nr:APC family permease [Peptococcaceae bacterium]
MIETNPTHGKLRQAFQLFDLSTLSVSSVAPMFSVAAAGGAMAQAAGAAVPLAIVLIAIPFLLCSWIFLSLNQHFPNAGASYHWSRRIIGINYSNYQAWIVIMAYFWSIPPILLPAATFTLGALGINSPSNALQMLVAILWALFAAAVLLWGPRLTARVTQIFLFVEVVSVLAMAIIGYASWGPAVTGAADFSFQHIHWVGVVVCMVIAATIVDGWEIDSYASEEAHKPRITPGWGGIIGALSVVVYYLTIWPLLLHQVPLQTLQNSSNTLGTWGAAVMPHFLSLLRIAVIASTAGSLWLTTFILSRALFAMSRDGLMAKWVGALNKHCVPRMAIIIPIMSSIAVVLMQVFFPSMQALFSVVLSAAGFFLVAEFLFDGINMFAFLVLHHKTVRHSMKKHRHMGLLLASVVVVASLSVVEVLFFIYGPKYIGSGIDQTIIAMFLLGIIYIIWLKWHKTGTKTFIFNENDASYVASAGPVLIHDRRY